MYISIYKILNVSSLKENKQQGGLNTQFMQIPEIKQIPNRTPDSSQETTRHEISSNYGIVPLEEKVRVKYCSLTWCC